MYYLTTFFNDFWSLLNEFSFFVLLGVMIAGCLHVIVPADFILKHLKNNNFSSVLKSALFGIPLPLCSCGVIPMAKSLEQSGASKGSVMSFMISTPITGVDSIAATYGIFGPAFAFYRVFSSICIALSAGMLMSFVDKKNNKNHCCSTNNESKSSDSNCCSSSKVQEVQSCCSSSKPKEESSCCSSNTSKAKTSAWYFKIINALDYGFNSIFKSLSATLLLGIILGTLLGMLLPDNLEQFLKDNYILSFAMVLLVSVPLYVCAVASLPIAASLVLSGFSPGAAFVFLSAGPATNAVDFTFILKLMGKKALVIYIGTIAVGSLMFGLLIDVLLQNQGLDINNFKLHNINEKDWLDYTSSVIILLLFAKFLVYDKFFSKPSSQA